MIVYFHGYESSPNSDKVEKLKELFPDKRVFSFSANIDPDIAKREVSIQIQSALVQYINKPGKVYFIGTSLGAWLASAMSDLFGVPALLLNPCYDPVVSLMKYAEIPDELRLRYTPIKFNPKKFVCCDPQDPVIDMTELLKMLNNVETYPGIGHRFGSPHFDFAATKFIKLDA
jgi:hypothetical protein